MIIAACGSESSESLVETGKKAVANKDYRAASIQFKNALQKEPNSGQIRNLLGLALLDSGDAAAAAVELGKAYELGYDPSKVIPPLAQSLLLTGQYKKLATSFSGVTPADTKAAAALKTSLAVAWDALGDGA